LKLSVEQVDVFSLVGSRFQALGAILYYSPLPVL